MVKLYYANIEWVKEPVRFEAYLQKMNIQRRAKVLRCKNEEDRQRSLLAGIVLRYALEQEGFSYEKLEFAQDTHGKPYIVNQQNVYFSLSHSGAYVICGIAKSNIGVDIEDVARTAFQRGEDTLSHIGRKCFTPKEYAIWEGSAKKKEYFLKLWTRKESYSKANGRGLSMDFSTIEVEGEHTVGNFWSDWLLEDYYVSIYVEAGSVQPLIRQEWKP